MTIDESECFTGRRLGRHLGGVGNSAQGRIHRLIAHKEAFQAEHPRACPLGRLEQFAHALSADVGLVESMPVTLLWMRPELSWEQSLSSQTLRDDK